MTQLLNNLQNMGQNIGQNSALGTLVKKAGGAVAGAIKDASTKTGVDFAYLLQQAKAESGFRTDIQAKTSSASGLYQFIESTWLGMVEKHGAKHGIDTTGKSKSEILALRNDPDKASAMAAEFASDNKQVLDKKWGGDVGSTELYFAHFLGAGQASSFLNAKDENPLQKAADLFPRAAKANKNVFYDRVTGRAKSINEVYAFFDKKFAVKGENAINLVRADNTSASAPNKIDALIELTQSSKNTETSKAESVKRSRRVGSSMVKHSTSVKSYNSIGAFQNLVVNPLEIMLLSKMDMLNNNKSSEEKRRQF